jgi:type I restriction enzyme S subunit
MSNKSAPRTIKQHDKPKLKPKLRFPEFRDAPEWEERRLGAVLTFQAGFPFDSASFTEECKGLRLIRNRDLRSDDTILFYSNSFDERFIVNDGDVLIGMDGDFTPCIWNKGKALLNQRVGRILPLKESSQAFLYYFLTMHLKDIEETTARTTVKHLSHSSVEQINEPIPEYAEQNKIGDCLFSLDELIATHGQKLDALNAHKKGLTQQLFPREGETLPHLRFPEFQGAPEWISDSLGNIFETSSGGTPERSVKEYWNGNIPWITTSLVDFSVICNSDEFISEAGLRNSSAKVFPKKTVLIAMYGQGKTRGKVALLGIEATTNQACAAILPREDIDPYFVFLNLAGRYDEMRGLSNSGGQENLSQGLIKGLPFSYPNDIAEQQKLSACLSSVDELITAQTENLEALKTQKQGLMQQLFPSPEVIEA